MTKHAFRRPSGYYFRYAIPDRYRHLLDQRELRYPLGTQERRTATRRASEVLHAVERLLQAVESGTMKLTPQQIRERVRAYVQARREGIDAEFLERRRTPAIQETHEHVLLDLLGDVEYAVQHSDYRRVASDLARFLRVTEEQALTDPDLAGIRRQWAKASAKLYRYQLGLYRGEPMAGDVEYLSSEQPDSGCAQETPKDSGRTLSDWLDDYIENLMQTSQPGRDARDRYKNAVANFEEIVGPVAANDITGGHVTAFMRDIQRLPRQRATRKEYRGRSVADLLAEGVQEADRFSATTINAYLRAISSMMKWLRESHGAVTLNPFDGKNLKAERVSRASYTDDDLERIFSSELWVPGSPYAARRGTASMWWLPLLALYTGARLSELIQMPLGRVREADGVLCLDLVGADKEGIKLKTAAARRLIPIHPRLEDFGFSDYVARLRVIGAARLLPAFPLGKEGKGSKASDWWTRYRNRNFPDFAGAQKVFHSFRTTHGTKAKTVGVNPILLKQWFGHADRQADDVTEAHYNTGQPAAMLLEEISKLHWDNSVVSSLPVCWQEMVLS